MNVFRAIAVLLALVVGLLVWRSAREGAPPLSEVGDRISKSAPPLPGVGDRIGHGHGTGVRVRPPPSERVGHRPPSEKMGHRLEVEDRPEGAPPLPGVGDRPLWLPSPDPPYHGLAIQVYSSDDAVSTYGRLVAEIAARGADTVLLSVNGYQKHVESTRIAPDANEMPSDNDWLRVFAAAHHRGLRIVLMPKILLSDPRGNAWRGKIQPTSWDEWFAQYEAFVMPFARLAERGGAEVFVVGSELITTERFTDRWRKIIADVRAVYGGRLTYSANWDHYKGIQFWDDLDLIGMTSYYKLSDGPGPSIEDLRARWDEIKTDILQWQKTVGKPLLFTEAGWCSQEGCSVEAWNYYRQEKATPAGLREQRDCYQAFVDTWVNVPQVGGILWWEWTPGDGGDGDYGYSPKNKPAEAVLRNLFRHARAQRNAAKPAPSIRARFSG